MPDNLLSVDDMSAKLTEIRNSKQNKANKKGGYNSAHYRADKDAISRAVENEKKILSENGRKGGVNLNNLEAVQKRTEAFFEACGRSGVIPTVEQLCILGYGMSRNNFYRYCREHDNATTEYIEKVRDCIAACLIDLSLQGCINPYSAMFALGNQHGFIQGLPTRKVSKKARHIEDNREANGSYKPETNTSK